MLRQNKKQSRQIEVSVVMPAFNEERSVGHAVSAVLRAFDDLELHFSNNRSYKVRHVAACDGIKSICRKKIESIY